MEKLRIGFLISKNRMVPAWYAATIRKIAEEPFCSPVFLLQEKKTEPPTTLLFRLFQRFEDSWFRNVYDAALEEHIDTPGKEAVLPPSMILSSQELAALQELKLDIIYTIDFSPAENENISRGAAQGLWYVMPAQVSFAPFWEVMDDRAVGFSGLYQRKDGIDKVLYEGSTALVPFSVKNSFNALAWKSFSYLYWKLKEWRSVGTGKFFPQLPIKIWKDRQRDVPGNWQLSFLATRNLFRYLRYKISPRNEGRFRLLYSAKPFETGNFKFEGFSSLPLPEGHFYADPFVVEYEQKHLLFFEDYAYLQGKAVIAVAELDRQGSLSMPVTVLEKPYHLSYPFVFSHEGAYYMIPETAGRQTVELYRASKFPGEWEFVMNLVEGRALVDVTLHHADGKWWMFANSFDHPFVSTNDQLFIFYSKNLFSNQWQPHARNPVATEAANCRPAGRLFRRDGKLYRPAQDNASRQYGFGLRINEVQLLTETEYREEPVMIFDKGDLLACHHIDASTGITVIDGIVG